MKNSDASKNWEYEQDTQEKYAYLPFKKHMPCC